LLRNKKFLSRAKRANAGFAKVKLQGPTVVDLTTNDDFAEDMGLTTFVQRIQNDANFAETVWQSWIENRDKPKVP
jgi:hypothetical protein